MAENQQVAANWDEPVRFPEEFPILLSARDWEEFTAAMYAPPREPNEALKRLMRGE